MAGALLAMVTDGEAQDLRVFSEIVEPTDAAGDRVVVSGGVDGSFFFKNDEYFAPAAEGYTLVGYRLRPFVEVYVDRFVMTAGLDAVRYGGMSRFHEVYPYFAATWRMADSLSLRIGDLKGPAAHRLPELLDDPEHQLAAPPETGAQFLFGGRTVAGEVWLNWRQFIFMGDTIPEKFTAGIGVDFFRHSDVFRMPVRLLFNHIGGQISNFEEPMQSIANGSVEPTVMFGRSVKAGVMLAGLHTMAGKDVRPFADGVAIQPKVRVERNWLSAEVSWLRTRNFYAPHGNPLLMSVSNYDTTVYEKNRSVVIVHADINKKFSVARFNLRGSAYYDTYAGRLDYAYYIGMTLSPRWRYRRYAGVERK